MSTQHTPGPWIVRLDDTGGQFTGWPSVVATDELDCSIVHRAGFKQEYWGDLSQCEAIANARLIAAAPDLLAELKTLRRAYVSLLETGRDRIIQHGGQCDSVEVMEAADPYLKSSKSAIAKATGETV